MAKKRITALVAIAAIAISATDVFPIVDTAGPMTNKVTMAAFRTALFAGGAGYSTDPLTTGALTVASGGLTVSAGTTAVQALTATTGTYTDTVAASTPTSVKKLLQLTSTNSSDGPHVTLENAASGAFRNWALSANYHFSGSLEFIVSNALSGNPITAGTPALTLKSDLSATFAGAMAVTGDFAVNTNKFTVTASSGNTAVAGTLGVTGAITGSSTIAATFAVTASSGFSTMKNSGSVTGVSTVATAITVAANAHGALAIVAGSDATNKFSDAVFYSNGVATVLASQTVAASPTARTYTVTSGQLKLAMASGTYTIYCTEFQTNIGT